MPDAGPIPHGSRPDDAEAVIAAHAATDAPDDLPGAETLAHAAGIDLPPPVLSEGPGRRGVWDWTDPDNDD